jgi:hypothetical protein
MTSIISIMQKLTIVGLYDIWCTCGVSNIVHVDVDLSDIGEFLVITTGFN